jgi:DNA primase
MAGRIPQSFIDDLLSRADIVEVIDRRVPLKKSGKNYSACCPFHDEKTPSFSVSPDKQFYYCFGCGAGGNALGFLMEYERLDFPRAIEVLADSLGLAVPREETPGYKEEAPQKPLFDMLEKAAQFYKEQLRQHPQATKAVDYLKKRGLTGITARDFSLGYAPPGWDNLIKKLGISNEDKKRLIDVGLLIQKEDDPNRNYDRFRDRIMFPIRDSRGRIIGFGGRVLTDEKPKYLNSPETAVFHKGNELYGLYEARQANRHLAKVLVVEGYMDVISLFQHGITWATATLGTATSTEHVRKLFRHTSEIVFCFDGDEAGRRAAQRALESCLPALDDGRRARFLFLPDGEDPDSIVQKHGRDALLQRIDKAQPLEDFLFYIASGDSDTQTLEGRARLAKSAAPLIGMLPDNGFRELMLRELSQRTGISGHTVDQLLEQSQSKPAAEASEAPAPRPQKRQPLPPRHRIQRQPLLYALGILLLYPQLASRIDQAPDFSSGSAGDNGDNNGSNPKTPSNSERILTETLLLLKRRPESNTNMLLGYWFSEPDMKELTSQALDQASYVDDEKAEQELLNTLEHLNQQRTEDHLDTLVDRLKRTDYAQLTATEKAQLQQLLDRKHSKN